MGQTFFTIEGHPQAVTAIKKCLKTKGNPYKIMETKDKTHYHLAAVFISNFPIALGSVALQLLKDYDFNEKEALDALSSLAVNNMKHLLSSGPKEALTGPIERMDQTTVVRHLEALSGRHIHLKETYKLLSEELIYIAQEKHRQQDYTALLEIIRKGEIS